ncbi:MAG: choice-of-anchor O protein [Desulfobulbaceae bacterium]|nr:choice-of-anchor O protein [Desulfobulbaceae bacterium]
MLKKMITTILFLALAAPLAWADNVTVHGTIGMLEAQLLTKTFEQVGTVEVWNTRDDFNIVVTPFSDRCLLSEVYVYLSPDPAPPPATKIVEANFGEWPYSIKYKKVPSADPYVVNLSLSDLGFEWGQWGEPYLEQRLRTVAVMAIMKTTDVVPVTFTAWAINPNVPLDVQRTAWGDNAYAMRYEMQHPMQGNFVGPVHGLTYATPTHFGTTGDQGGFSFYPGEDIYFWIGDTFIGSGNADQRFSPLDAFPGLDIDDDAVVSMACLLLGLDTSDNPSGALEIPETDLGLEEIDFTTCEDLAGLPNFTYVTAQEALAWLEQAIGNSVFRRNVSKNPDYAVDKPKLDIIPVWVPARTASGVAATVEYKDSDGNVLDTRDKVKPLMVTYMEEQDNTNKGMRRASDIITAVSMDDGATWKRFNVSHMAGHSSFTLGTGEKFPGNSRGPVQVIAEDKILVVWTSAYARGGKPRVAIKTTDDYTDDDEYAVRDLWGVRGRQGSVDYDEVDEVADQGFGEIPYYALWACRGVLVWSGNTDKYPDSEIGDIVWFKPERLTTGRRDAFQAVVSGAKNVGFGIAWQEDPGGLRPGKCSAGGHGWSGATVHKKTDIWYSFIKYADFELIDTNFNPVEHSADEHAADLGEETHSQQPEISNRPKWQVPMSLPVRVSDNNTVNTDNMRVQLDEAGMPVVVDGSFVPLAGAEEEDWVRHEHEHDETCGASEEAIAEEEEHGGQGGNGGGWGMARYAYMLPELGPLADTSGANVVWDATELGEFRPGEMEGTRWYRFVNQPGSVKTVAIAPDGRVLDGDTGAGRPNLKILPGGWALLGYEETKGLGEPPDDEAHHDLEPVDELAAALSFDEDADEFGEKGKDVIYHSFKFDNPDVISGGNVVNLPALDDSGNLVPVYYKDANGGDTDVIRQYATENARRVRFIAQPKPDMLKNYPGADTAAVVLYKQGREGNGKPSDIFAVRVVVPPGELNSTSKANPYRFENFVRYDSGAEASGTDAMRYQRRHMNMTSATVEAQDPTDIAVDYEGHAYGKVLRWNQYGNNISDESFANPYSDAKGHRGFIRGDKLVIAYSFTPNWGRLGGDHLDFYVRRSFDGGRTFTTDPNGPEETVHTVIEKDPVTKEYVQKQYRYGRGDFEPARNVSLLKGNRFTVTDPRLVPPMGEGSTVNKTYPEDDTYNPDVYYMAFGTAEVIHGIADPRTTDTVKADIFYSRTTDAGSNWLMVPWVINPDSASPEAGETVYRFPWLAQGTPHQGHAQMRMHPSGTRFYTIWHQFTDGDEAHASPHDIGDDIWFRRIDFME